MSATRGIVAGASVAAMTACAGPARVEPGILRAQPETPPAPFWVEIPEAAHKFEMVPIPGNDDGSIRPFWMSRTEITWDAFDVFTFKLDAPGHPDADAVSRPSKPYIPPDRGFGHAGYAVISVSFRNANEFCAWLSARTGRKFRLATVHEWTHACLAGSAGPYTFGDDVALLADHAWYEANADYSPQPVGRKKPNAWGLHDMHGNVQEWVTTDDGKGTTCGGSFRDEPERLRANSRAPYQPGWQASDPQIPKSPWWLSDGPFVGFRVVAE